VDPANRCTRTWGHRGGVLDTTALRRTATAALCPLRPGHPCTLCHPEAKAGPQDCPTVALVMDDPKLRAEAARLRAERQNERPAARRESVASAS